MKKEYEALEMEIILFSSEDVITASGGPKDDIELPELDN